MPAMLRRSYRWSIAVLALVVVFATSARAERPREEDEFESVSRPRPTVSLPLGWKLGDAVTFPRQLLPLFKGDFESGIAEPEDDGTTVLKPFGGDVEHPVTPGMFTNVRANDPSGDNAAATQSENSIAAFGRFLAAGWNDSFDTATPGSFSGFGYSSDGGRTWHDGGILPHASGERLLGDPSLTVDGKGTFFYAQLYARPGVSLAVAVNRGRFVNDTLRFEPAVVANIPVQPDQLDKEWIAADRENGTLYLSYTHFMATGPDQIELIRSKDHGMTWSEPLVLTNPATESVQGSRPAVGPDGELYVVYSVTDLTDFSNHMRIRKSTDGGRHFGPSVNVGELAGSAGLSPNFPSGPPGFNRQFGVEFPSIAVNHGGHGKGTVYVAWNEAVDWLNDPLGGGGVVAETENNGSAATANAITIGQTVTGRYDNSTDLDFFSFTGHAGETVEFFLTPPQGAQSEGFLRLFAPGGTVGDRLAFSSLGGGQAFVLFTLPADGTYYIRPGILNANAKQGPYVLFTGLHAPRATDIARDSRDAVIASSRDGMHWTQRVVVNDDAPRYDNAFTEVATDRDGKVHVVWYDHRNDATKGILTDLYATVSDDGGRTFAPNRRVNDAPGINWNNIPSRLAPNMGDYIALTSSGDNVYAVWADGRLGTPDTWTMQLQGGHHPGGDDDAEDDDDARAITSRVAASASEGLALALHVASPTRAGAPLSFALDLPVAGDASLELYSVTGQRVRTVADGVFAAGRHTLTWDARGRDGSLVAPGLYFAVVTQGSARVQQRVVRVR